MAAAGEKVDLTTFFASLAAAKKGGEIIFPFSGYGRKERLAEETSQFTAIPPGGRGLVEYYEKLQKLKQRNGNITKKKKKQKVWIFFKSLF